VKDSVDVPIMLVGSKSDLTDQRMVTTEEGEYLAKQHNVSFLEVSAKNNINVDQCFLDLLKEVAKKKPVENKTHKKKHCIIV
jgi:GTPase SAR1 family protein